MTRRSLAAVLAAATLLPGSLGAQAADPAPEYPRSTCTKRFTDPQGDATAPTAQKAPGLDIIGGFLRTTDTAVQVFLEVDDVPTAIPATDPAYRYTVELKYNAKLFKFQGILANSVYGSQVFGDTSKMTATPGANDHTGGIDATKDFFWVSMPRATFESKAGIPLEAGAMFDSVKFITEWIVNNGAGPQKIDYIEPTGDAAKWAIFDDYCFGPPPGKLSDLTVKNVQYGDATTMSAKLVSDTDAPLAGKTIQFSIAGDPTVKSATTDANGVATATFASKVLASKTPYVVTALFPGDETDGKAKLTGSIVVSQEKTAFAAPKIAKPSATARTVTATLLDDDKKPVVGQKVEFLVNGKKLGTVVTNSKGQAVFKGAKAGQTVQTRFLAVTGKYLAALSSKYKV